MSTTHRLPPPGASFGHGLRGLWTLDPAIRFLNHGSFGAAPRHVLAAQARWREALEREPVLFMVDELPEALLAARNRLAQFVGAVPQRLTFVDNATAGVNAVLRSLPWRAGDRIVIADHAYPGVKNAARFVAARHGLTLVEARVPWPLSGPEEIVAAYEEALQGGARLVIVDHVFAPLAVVAPVEEIVRLCRARGVPVLVDGAHAPGMLPLALDALGPTGTRATATSGCARPRAAPSSTPRRRASTSSIRS
jgi:isopenicillin-N epimerase